MLVEIVFVLYAIEIFILILNIFPIGICMCCVMVDLLNCEGDHLETLTIDDEGLNDFDRLTRDNLIRVVREEGIPPCFDTKKQYDHWLEAEKTSATEPFRRNICEDCVRSFKMLMCEEKRCVNRHYKVAEDEV